MRTRTKTNTYDAMQVNPVHVLQYLPNGVLQNNYYNNTISMIAGVSDDETMHDEVQAGRKSKTVFHKRTIFRRQNLEYEVYYTPGNYRTEVAGPGAHWSAWGAYGQDIVHENIQVNWSKPLSSLIRQAKNAFYDMNKVDSLLNVVEAPELVTSLKPLYQRLLFPKYIDKKMDRRDIKKILTNAKGALGLLTGGFLYYSFGVAPLVSDLRKVSKATSTYARDLERAMNKSGMLESVHVRDTGTVSKYLIGPNPTGHGSDSLNNSYWHTVPYGTMTPLRVCTVRGIRTKKYYTDLIGRLDVLARTFGVSGPASFAWERVKFSFVLDWFVDLSDILNKLDNALTGSTKEIKDITVSEKWRVLCPVIKHLPSSGNDSSHDGHQTALVELHNYQRSPVPDNIEVGLSGRFGKKQGFLTGALVGQMAANLKRKGRGL